MRKRHRKINAYMTDHRCRNRLEFRKMLRADIVGLKVKIKKRNGKFCRSNTDAFRYAEQKCKQAIYLDWDLI